MIIRFNKIIQTGVFRNTPHLDHLTFKKFTAFYALNTHGKTTLKDIFLSIAEDNPRTVEKRRSIPHDPLLQEVSLTYVKNGHEQYMHFSDGWNPNHLKGKIMVFDNDFIHKNIITGFSITRDNKESFTDFILGEEGVALSEKIGLLNRTLKEKKATLVKPDYLKHGKSQKDIDAFLHLEVLEAESELQKMGIALVTQMDNLSNREEILKLPVVSPLSLTLEAQLAHVVERLNSVLSREYKTVPQNLKENLSSHFNRCQHNEGLKSWIKQGLKHHKKNTCCPFCGQDVTYAQELMDAYHNFFNEEYEAFAKEIAMQLHSIERDLDAITFSIKMELLTLVNQLNKYKPYISTINTEIEDKNIFALENILQEKLQVQKEEIKRRIAAKNKEPHQVFSPVLLNMELVSALYNLQFALNDHQQMNLAIASANKLKSEHAALATDQVNAKRDALIAKIQEVEKKLARLRQNGECTTYRAELAYILELTAEVTNKADQLKTQQSTYLKDFFDELNALFMALGTRDFQLSCEASPYGNKKVYELKISFNGKKLSTDEIAIMLSESDKRNLAFCIFFTRIRQLKNPAELIVVLDDPTVSFDEQRTLAASDAIKKMQSQCSQMVLLTHSSFLIKAFVQSHWEGAYFEIKKNNVTSTITELNKVGVLEEREIQAG